jgi:hypothetical protein
VDKTFHIQPIKQHIYNINIPNFSEMDLDKRKCFLIPFKAEIIYIYRYIYINTHTHIYTDTHTHTHIKPQAGRVFA